MPPTGQGRRRPGVTLEERHAWSPHVFLWRRSLRRTGVCGVAGRNLRAGRQAAQDARAVPAEESGRSGSSAEKTERGSGMKLVSEGSFDLAFVVAGLRDSGAFVDR